MSKKKRRKLTEYDILDLIVERLVAVYGYREGPQGEPGVQGPMGPPGPQGPPGVCQCGQWSPGWWQSPIVSNTTPVPKWPELQYLYRYSACQCTWIGSKDMDPPAYCQHHPNSSLSRKEPLSD